MPGTVGPAHHLAMWTATTGRLDLAGTRSSDEALCTLEGPAAARPGEPVVGYGHRPGHLAGQPTVAMLDEVAPDVPVVW